MKVSKCIKIILFFQIISFSILFSRETSIYVGDSYGKLKEELGFPERTKDTGRNLFISYDKQYGVNFLIGKTSNCIKEFRINSNKCIKGSVYGLKIGDSLFTVFKLLGSPKKEFFCSKKEVSACFRGTDYVLYKVSNGSKKYIIGEKGVLFWCNSKDEIVQIVLFKPYREPVILDLNSSYYTYPKFSSSKPRVENRKLKNKEKQKLDYSANVDAYWKLCRVTTGYYWIARWVEEIMGWKIERVEIEGDVYIPICEIELEGLSEEEFNLKIEVNFKDERGNIISKQTKVVHVIPNRKRIYRFEGYYKIPKEIMEKYITNTLRFREKVKLRRKHLRRSTYSKASGWTVDVFADGEFKGEFDIYFDL